MGAKAEKKNVCVARGFDLRIHFKNTYETANAIKGMLIKKAKQYLEAVLDHQRCIPFLKYNKSIGRTGQAKEFKHTKGRWPEKSVKYVLSLLKNLESNAEVAGLNVDKLVVSRVSVNQAAKGRRRTFRAHGRINAYMSCQCHIELYGSELVKPVPKENRKSESEDPSKRLRNPKLHIRKAITRHLKSRKLVPIGKVEKKAEGKK